jgi:uncharacterized DUF497 family protein
MLNVRRLIWSDSTVAHIARHEVSTDEAVEVCFGEPIVLEGHSGRLLIIGPTQKQRMITVVVDPEEEEGVYSMVTARPAARKERRIYQREKGGEANDQTD